MIYNHICQIIYFLKVDLKRIKSDSAYLNQVMQYKLSVSITNDLVIGITALFYMTYYIHLLSLDLVIAARSEVKNHCLCVVCTV